MSVLRRQHDQHLRRRWPTRMSSKVRLAFALLPALGLGVASRQETAEPAVGLAVGRVGENLEAIDRDQARADQQLDGLALSPLIVGAHHAGEAVAVGYADGGKAERARQSPPSPGGCEAPRRKEKLVVTASSA